MKRADIPVKHDGKAYRMIISGDSVGLFDKNGLAKKLQVSGDFNGRRIPEVVTESGDPVKLTKTSRPCSCKGAPWKTGITKLLEQL